MRSHPALKPDGFLIGIRQIDGIHGLDSPDDRIIGFGSLD